MVDGDTGILIIDSSVSGTLTLPATSDPTTITYSSSSKTLATVLKYGGIFIWTSRTLGITPD